MTPRGEKNGILPGERTRVISVDICGGTAEIILLSSIPCCFWNVSKKSLRNTDVNGQSSMYRFKASFLAEISFQHIHISIRDVMFAMVHA